MNILNILTKNNVKILKLIDKESLHIRDIADKLNISPGSVHKLIKILKKDCVIKEIKEKNRLIIDLNRESPITKEIKSIINFNDWINSSAYKKLKKIGNLGLYGSFANGTNDSGSDLDVWIKTEKKELEIRPVIRELEKELNIQVNPLILTKKKINLLKKNDPEFYTRLKLTSVGDLLDQ